MNSSDDVLVKFSDVTKQYGDLVVLDKLNLEIKKNEKKLKKTKKRAGAA